MGFDVKYIMPVVDANKDGTLSFSEFKAAYDLIAKNYSDYIEGMKLLKEGDKDGNGFIDKEEMHRYVKENFPETEDEKIDEILQEVDLDGDGKVDYAEFLAKFLNKWEDSL